MIQVQKGKFSTSKINAAINTTVTQDVAAVASIPGWNFLVNPAVGMFDQVMLGRKVTRRGGDVAPASETPDGNSMAAFPLDGSITYVHDINAQVNSERWTAFFVCYLPAGNGPDEVFTQPSDLTSDDVALRFGFNTTGTLRVWRGDTNSRISYSGENFYDRTVYCMATFSIDDGLRLFVNGAEVAHDPTQTAPLTSDYIQLFAPGGMGAVGGYSGYMGRIGLLDTCLAELPSEKAALDAWLMELYGIGA